MKYIGQPAGRQVQIGQRGAGAEPHPGGLVYRLAITRRLRRSRDGSAGSRLLEPAGSELSAGQLVPCSITHRRPQPGGSRFGGKSGGLGRSGGLQQAGRQLAGPQARKAAGREYFCPLHRWLCVRVRVSARKVKAAFAFHIHASSQPANQLPTDQHQTGGQLRARSLASAGRPAGEPELSGLAS